MLIIRLAHDAKIRSIVREYNLFNVNELLNNMTCGALDECLDKLQHCCKMLSNYDSMIIAHLSVAINDYLIPSQDRSMHKLVNPDINGTA